MQRMLNNKVTRINMRKKDSQFGPWRGCIIRFSIKVRIQSESDPLYSIRPICPSHSFSSFSSFLIFPSLSRMCSLSKSTSISDVEYLVSGWRIPLSLFRRSAMSPLPKKASECTSREKNALEISFAEQFIEGKKARLSIRRRNNSISWEDFSTCRKLYRHQFYKIYKSVKFKILILYKYICIVYILEFMRDNIFVYILSLANAVLDTKGNKKFILI